MQASVGTGSAGGVNEAMIPLQFWFCRNPGLALPLIALQYHEVKVKCTWQNVGGAAGTAGNNIEMWADYVYLDTDERRRFAQVSHEYLIEQVQTQTVASTNASVRLNFNHPVKELIWTTAANAVVAQTAKLTLNGHDRFSTQVKEYFQLRQPYQHHTAVPRNNLPVSAHDSTRTILSANVTVPADATDPAFTILQPADTTIVSVGLIVTGSFTTGAGDTAFNVGTGAGGTQLVAGANAVNNDASAVVTGAVISTSQPVLGNAGTTQLALSTAAPLYTSSSRTIHGTITTAAAVTSAGTAKMFIQVVGGQEARTSTMTRAINVYSFALKPEEHQPSGTCNFSRIDSAFLNYSATLAGNVNNVFAHNYNVLRVMSGMGGLAYSN